MKHLFTITTLLLVALCTNAQLSPISNVVFKGGVTPGYTTEGEPGATNGTIRWNPVSLVHEGWNGAAWAPIAGSGSGFPLTNTVNADTNSVPGRFGVTNLSHIQAGTGFFARVYAEDTIYISSTGGTGQVRFNGERLTVNGSIVGSGFGSINRVSAPTNAATGQLGLFIPNPAMLTLVPSDNMEVLMTQLSPTNVQISFRAASAIPGPPGAAGLGTNFFYIGNYAAGKVTATEGPTIASYGGQVWITTNLGYTIPPDTQPDSSSESSKWGVWISKGVDGLDGAPSLSLSLVQYTNEVCLTTNNLFTFGGSLWLPKRDICPAPPPYDLQATNYVQLVARGANAADTNIVFQYITWAGTWAAQNAYPSNSLVFYPGNQGIPQGIYLSERDIESPDAWPGQEGWRLLFLNGQDGVSGPPGLNGIGNLLYASWFDRTLSYPENTLVSYINPYTGKKNLYRAQTLAAAKLYPNLYPNIWEEIISSGADATVTQWEWRGAYSGLESYDNNQLVRHLNKIYFSKYPVSFSGVSPSATGAGTYWEEFVRDGTSIASNLVWRGAHDVASIYAPGDMVSYLGSLWVVTNAAPITNSTPSDLLWTKVVSKGDTGPEGPASTNSVTIWNYTNTLIVLTQQVQNTWITNISYGTNFVTELFQTNLFNVSNTQFITYNTQGVNRVEAFGVTNETPTSLRVTTGNAFNHTIDPSFMSTLVLSTNFAAVGSGSGTGIVSGSYFEVDMDGGLTPRIELVPFDLSWYYDDDGNIVPR